MNLATLFLPLALYSLRQWSVESHTCEPIVKGNFSFRCLLAWTDCEILALRRLSWASSTSISKHWITCHVSMSVMVADDLAGTRGGIILELWPKRNWKGIKPVNLFTVFIMSKWTQGSAWTQPSWFCSTWYHKAWLTVLFVCSLAPSVSGWYAVDSFNFMPVSLWRAIQNFDMKSLTLSETMSDAKCDTGLEDNAQRP